MTCPVHTARQKNTSTLHHHRAYIRDERIYVFQIDIRP